MRATQERRELRALELEYYRKYVTRRLSVCSIALISFVSQLKSTKTSDGKATLLHFVVKTVQTNCPDILKVKNELSHAASAAKGLMLTVVHARIQFPVLCRLSV